VRVDVVQIEEEGLRPARRAQETRTPSGSRTPAWRQTQLSSNDPKPRPKPPDGLCFDGLTRTIALAEIAAVS
jgi:hypothetical protein